VPDSARNLLYTAEVSGGIKIYNLQLTPVATIASNVTDFVAMNITPDGHILQTSRSDNWFRVFEPYPDLSQSLSWTITNPRGAAVDQFNNLYLFSSGYFRSYSVCGFATPTMTVTATMTATATVTVTAMMTVTATMSVTPEPAIHKEPGVVIYPNPSKEVFLVHAFDIPPAAQKVRLDIYTNSFRLVKREEMNVNAFNVYTAELKDFAAGIYVMRITFYDGPLIVYRCKSFIVLIK
jgi:hypothetical protein